MATVIVDLFRAGLVACVGNFTGSTDKILNSSGIKRVTKISTGVVEVEFVEAVDATEDQVLVTPLTQARAVTFEPVDGIATKNYTVARVYVTDLAAAAAAGAFSLAVFKGSPANADFRDFG